MYYKKTHTQKKRGERIKKIYDQIKSTQQNIANKKNIKKNNHK